MSDNMKTNKIGLSVYLNQLVAVCFQELLRLKTMFTVGLFPTIIRLLLYSIVFVNVLSLKIHEMGGMSYKNFVLPGLIIMTVITNVFSHVANSLFSSKRQGYIADFLVSGVSEWSFIISFIFGGVLRGLTVACIAFITIFLVMHYQPQDIFLSLLLVIITSVLFSALAIVAGLLISRVETLTACSLYVIMPITMFGGVYYSPDMLTGTWYKITILNPVYSVVHSFRQACYGSFSMQQHMTSIVFILGVLFSVLLIARFLIHRVSYKTR